MAEVSQAPIAGIVLAAGSSTRMGRPKLLLTHEGIPLLRRSVDAAVDGGCDEVIVVVGAHAEQYSQMLSPTAAKIVVNPNFAEGLSTSIRSGIEALSETVGAVVLLLADQPFIDRLIVRRLIETYRTSGKRIVTCQYDGVLGAPTLFDRALFIELLVLEGDRGARAVVETYPRHVATVEIPLQAASDIDTPTDAKRLSAR